MKNITTLTLLLTLGTASFVEAAAPEHMLTDAARKELARRGGARPGDLGYHHGGRGLIKAGAKGDVVHHAVVDRMVVRPVDARLKPEMRRNGSVFFTAAEVNGGQLAELPDAHVDYRPVPVYHITLQNGQLSLENKLQGEGSSGPSTFMAFSEKNLVGPTLTNDGGQEEPVFADLSDSTAIKLIALTDPNNPNVGVLRAYIGPHFGIYKVVRATAEGAMHAAGENIPQDSQGLLDYGTFGGPDRAATARIAEVEEALKHELQNFHGQLLPFQTITRGGYELTPLAGGMALAADEIGRLTFGTTQKGPFKSFETIYKDLTKGKLDEQHVVIFGANGTKYNLTIQSNLYNYIAGRYSKYSAETAALGEAANKPQMFMAQKAIPMGLMKILERGRAQGVPLQERMLDSLHLTEISSFQFNGVPGIFNVPIYKSSPTEELPGYPLPEAYKNAFNKDGQTIPLFDVDQDGQITNQYRDPRSANLLEAMERKGALGKSLDDIVRELGIVAESQKGGYLISARADLFSAKQIVFNYNGDGRIEGISVIDVMVPISTVIDPNLTNRDLLERERESTDVRLLLADPKISGIGDGFLPHPDQSHILAQRVLFKAKASVAHHDVTGESVLQGIRLEPMTYGPYGEAIDQQIEWLTAIENQDVLRKLGIDLRAVGRTEVKVHRALQGGDAKGGLAVTERERRIAELQAKKAKATLLEAPSVTPEGARAARIAELQAKAKGASPALLEAPPMIAEAEKRAARIAELQAKKSAGGSSTNPPQ